ncbi:MAG: biotin transporter BioY [Actinomycetota bacterium]
MSTKDLSYIAIFAALVAALGLFPPIPVPVIPVPVTAQTMGVMLAGSILGAKRAGLSMLVFLALVALGIPALSGGRGGLGVFAGPSGGFLIGWPIGAFVIGLLAERSWDSYNVVKGVAFNLLGGICAVYAVGIPWLAAATNIEMHQAAAGSAAFLPGDALKAVAAAWVAVAVRRAYPLIDSASAR